jgi:hypothetical protein
MVAAHRNSPFPHLLMALVLSHLHAIPLHPKPIFPNYNDEHKEDCLGTISLLTFPKECSVQIKQQVT